MDESLKSIFRRNLLFLIAKSGKSQSEIAKDLDIHMPTFNAWCTGASVPRMDRLETLAAYFGIKPSELLIPQVEKSEDLELLKSICCKLAAEILEIPASDFRQKVDEIL